ncbi:MAG: hypothetical protein R3D85_17740 [Paracoccaceae bacterium]
MAVFRSLGKFWALLVLAIPFVMTGLFTIGPVVMILPALAIAALPATAEAEAQGRGRILWVTLVLGVAVGPLVALNAEALFLFGMQIWADHVASPREAARFAELERAGLWRELNGFLGSGELGGGWIPGSLQNAGEAFRPDPKAWGAVAWMQGVMAERFARILLAQAISGALAAVMAGLCLFLHARVLGAVRRLLGWTRVPDGAVLGAAATALVLAASYWLDIAAMAPGRGRQAAMWALTGAPVLIFLLALLPAVALRLGIVARLNRAASRVLAGIEARDAAQRDLAAAKMPRDAVPLVRRGGVPAGGAGAESAAKASPLVQLRETVKERLAASRQVQRVQWGLVAVVILGFGYVTDWTFMPDGGMGGSGGMQAVSLGR